CRIAEEAERHDPDEHGARPLAEIVDDALGILGPAADDREPADRTVHQPARGETEPGHYFEHRHVADPASHAGRNGVTAGAFRSVPLDADRNAHAAANAEGGEALLGVALPRSVDQGGEDAGPLAA